MGKAEGLPFAMVAGRKYPPLNEGRRWLAARIQRRGQPPPGGATGGASEHQGAELGIRDEHVAGDDRPTWR
jgi:hypothetical protein